MVSKLFLDSFSNRSVRLFDCRLSSGLKTNSIRCSLFATSSVHIFSQTESASKLLCLPFASLLQMMRVGLDALPTNLDMAIWIELMSKFQSISRWRASYTAHRNIRSHRLVFLFPRPCEVNQGPATSRMVTVKAARRLVFLP